MEASRPPTLTLTHEKEKRKGGERRRGESGARPSQIFMLKVTGDPRRNVDLAANTLSKENTKMS